MCKCECAATCLFAIISLWQVQQRKASFKPRSEGRCHICSILMELNPVVIWVILTSWGGETETCLDARLKCIEECDSTSLCSPCAMLYHDYTKDSLLTSWLPPLAHIENDQRCKDIAQPHFRCGSEPPQGCQTCSLYCSKEVSAQRPDGVRSVVWRELM